MRAAASKMVLAAVGLLLLASSAMGSASSTRKLLQCTGGCQAWVRGWGGRQTCAACCSGFLLQNGGCIATTTGVATAPLVLPSATQTTYTTTTPTRGAFFGPRGTAATSTTTGAVTREGSVTTPAATATSTTTATVDATRVVNPAGATATTTTTGSVTGGRVRYPVGGTATTTTTGSVTGTGVVYPVGGSASSSTTATASRTVDPRGPRGPTTASATRTTTTDFQRRGFKLLQLSGVDVGRQLLQGCSGGCASWRTQHGGRRTCAACCSGFVMQNGACVAQRTTVQRNPSSGTTAVRRTGAAVGYGH